MTIREHLIKFKKEYYKDSETLKNFLTDIIDQGVLNGAIPQLTYNTDFENFYQKHVEEIWDLLTQDAEEVGLSPIEFINHYFGRKHLQLITDEVFLHTALVAYAAEREAEFFLEELEGED